MRLLRSAPQPGAKPPEAQVEGYLLATVTRSDVTGWVYYTGMPDAATLKHDMADMLAGNGQPAPKQEELELHLDLSGLEPVIRQTLDGLPIGQTEPRSASNQPLLFPARHYGDS